MMRNLILIALLTMFGYTQAQTVRFSEDFETAPYQLTSDSVVGNLEWDTTTFLQYSGNQSYKVAVTTNSLSVNDEVTLTTTPFTTNGDSKVLLEFKQIAKLYLFNGGYIEVRPDTVSNWIKLDDSTYIGSGFYSNNTGFGHRFNSASYAVDWDASNFNTIPDNSWWKKETFDLSDFIGGATHAQVRFVMKGKEPKQFGWVIDDIKITSSMSELTPPSISIVTPYPVGSIIGTGPFEVSAHIEDNSGVASAGIVFEIAGVVDTVPMYLIANNLYKGIIPSQTYLTSNCYYLIATDSSSNSNIGSYPSLSCITFVNTKDPSAPAYADYDVALHSIPNPPAVIVSGVNIPVQVRIQNKCDTVTLTKAKVAWAKDGVIQPDTFDWTGSITTDVVSNLLLLDSTSFTNGSHTIKAWAFDPNDSLDQMNTNDTMEIGIFGCSEILNGTYTLGGSSAYFNDFKDLFSTLHNCGMNGPTIIKVNPGVYNEKLNFTDSIIGLNSINTLTIVSSTRNRDDVTIEFNRTGSINYVIAFNNISHITFKHISIAAKGSESSNSSTIRFEEKTTEILFDSCSIISPFSTAFANTIYATGIEIQDNTISNSNIEGGYYAVQMTGSSSSKQLRNNFLNNKVYNFYRVGIYITHSENIGINGNEIIRAADNVFTTSLQGIYIGSSISPSITSNKIVLAPQHSNQDPATTGIYIQSSTTILPSNRVIANNSIIVNGISTSASRGIHLNSSSKNFGIYHNSIAIYSGNTSQSNGIYFAGGSTNNHIKNNSFASFNSSIAVNAASTSTNNTFDYNNYYTNGLVLFKWGGITTSPAQGTSAISALTGGDANSIITNPKYYGTYDLHSYSPTLNNAGTPIAVVPEDFEGDLRDPLTPDIGADEFIISSSDVGVTHILSPLAVDTQGNSLNLKVVVLNFGTASVSAMDIKYTINGGTAVTYAWTGSLASNDTVHINVGSITLPANYYSITAYTDVITDTVHGNDTTSVINYAFPLIDATIASLEQPMDGCDKGANEIVEVLIKNFGAGSINNGLSVSYQVNGGSIITENVVDTIATNDSLLFTFTQTVDMTTGFQDSLFEFTLKTIHSGDGNNTNDSVQFSAISKGHLYPPIVNDTTINYGDQVTLTAISNDPIRWFENDTTNVILGNDTYTTPNLFDTTTYYAQAGGVAPPAQTTVGTGSGTWGPYSNSSVYSGYGFASSKTKTQILYKASELISAGLSAGPISALAFNVGGAFSAPPSFDLYIGNTSVSSLTTTFESMASMTHVFTGTFVATPGWNTHTFITPFIWDGVSNIIVQTCTQGGQGFAPMVKYTPTTYNSQVGIGGYGPSAPNCASVQGSSVDLNFRPNIRFTGVGFNLCTSSKVPLVVTAPFPAIDAMVKEIVNPKDDCGLNSTSVTIDIVGMGSDTITSPFTATFKIDNGAYITPESITDSLAPGDTLRYTFTTLASLAPGANGTNYTITAKVNVPNDAYAANDSLESASILSKYTPTNPIVSNMTVNYGDSAQLTASSPDSIYWYADSMVTMLIGTGSSFMSNPIYDTTTFYAVSQKTIPNTTYTLGTGTNSNTATTGPSPYGAGGNNGWGPSAAKTQMLITAAELSALGMIQGPITSISFNVALISQGPSNSYSIKLGTTERTEMTGSYFVSDLTTVYTRNAHTTQVSWNTHIFDTPYYWDGVSNIIVETFMKNSNPVSFAGVRYTTTSNTSVGFSTGSTSFTYADSTIYYTSNHRPNIRFEQTGLGLCASDPMPLVVSIPAYANIDASLISFIEPMGSASSVVNSPVKILLKNYGLTTMTAASIGWEENGMSMTSYAWTGSLAKGEVDTVTLDANHNFLGGNTTLRAWVNLTNDTIQTNDTVSTYLDVCMSGSYTINPINGDYHSFTEAINDLHQIGICGPVVFNVDSGTYAEKLALFSVSGSSSINTITFQSTQLDSSAVTLTSSTLLNTNYTFNLDGVSNIIIKHLTLSSNGGQYGNVITLEGGANNIEISNNRIISTNSILNQTYASAVHTYRSGVSDILIENNNIINGYKAINFEAENTNKNSDIQIIGNTFSNYTARSIYANYVENLLIKGNDIESGIAYTQVYGIHIYKGENVDIIKNDLKLSSTGATYGLNMTIDGSSTNVCDISNNFISISGGNGDKYGMRLDNSSYVDFNYNSINIISGDPKALYLSNGSHQKYYNNSISATLGYAIYSTNIPSNIQLDNNNIYTDPQFTSLFVKWSSDQENLDSLQAFDVSNNQNSISVNPEYYTVNDLHSRQIDMYNTGTPISGITTDIDNETRKLTNPSIGADEFTPPAIDLGVVGMPYPDLSDCGYSSSDSIVIRIKNYGLNNLNFATSAATINVVVTGTNPITIPYVLNSGILNSTDFMDVKVSSTYNLSTRGEYIFDASVSIAGDGEAINNNMNTVNIVSYPTINSFPFSEDFESGLNTAFKEFDTTESVIFVGGSAANLSNFGLHFTGGGYSTAWYSKTNSWEAFDSNPARLSTATTCDIDATSMNSLSLQFDLKQTFYSTVNSNTSWFRVLLTDANNNTHYLKDLNGDSAFLPTTVNIDPFTRHTFNLNKYTGQVFYISFQAINKIVYGGGSFDGDNAFVDNISIWEPSPNDVGATSIISQNKHGNVGGSYAVKATIMNFGSDTLYTIPVAYQVNMGTIVRDTMYGVFFPSQTDTFTFATTYSLVGGAQNLCVFTELTADADMNNDSTCVEIKGMETYAVNYETDFEMDVDWFGSGTFNQWEQGTPNTTNITAANSGVEAWVTRLTSLYAGGIAEEYLYSPYFTIPTYAGTAKLEFFMNMQVNVGYARGTMEFSFDGVNWAAYGYMSDPNSLNWYNQQLNGQHFWSMNTTGWIPVYTMLDSATFNTGQPFQLRFNFSTTPSTIVSDGWGIDDFAIKVPIMAIDAGVNAIFNPLASTVAGDSVTVTVEIKNFGTDTLTTFPVSYSINGNVISTETWNGTLLSDSTEIFTFSSKYYSGGTDYSLCAYTSLIGDMQLLNDTICSTILATPGKMDAGVSTVIAPAGQTNIYNPTTVKVRIRNYGTDTLFTIPVEYLLNGSSKAIETFVGTIAPGDSADYTFNTTYTSGVGQYSICGRTNLIGDVDITNDQECVSVIGSSLTISSGDEFFVDQNQPNPSKTRTNIDIYLPKSGTVQFKLVNVLGAEVINTNYDFTQGRQRISLSTATLNAGIYYYSVTFEGQMKTFKMIVVR